MVRDDEKGLLWKLPELRTPDLGKLGPGFGFGVGCGVGVGAGLVGVAGLGFAFPGLHFGVGAGAGCGIGIGFGYGLGWGMAFDEHGSRSHLGKYFYRQEDGNSGAEIGAIIDDFIRGVRQAFKSLGKEIGKRR